LVIYFLQDDILPFVSSIFLRRLMLPGVHHNAALHATLAEYNRHLGESDLQALTADGLKKEILSLIEHEVFVVIFVKFLSSRCISLPLIYTDKIYYAIGWI
jgi:nuclear pore complex protein Nup160